MKKSLTLLLVLAVAFEAFCQSSYNEASSTNCPPTFQPGVLSYNGSGTYELTERTDLRRYDNGRYTGLMSREVSSFIIPVANEDGYIYDGRFYVVENTRRNMAHVALSLNDAIPSVFKIDKNGQLTMIEDHGFPSYRSFPTFPSMQIKKGDSWEGKAERAVDPLNKGVVTKMPVYVRYTYTGDSVFYGEDVYVISAQWATRYGMGFGNYYIDWGGDSDLKRATGGHKATIYVSKLSGNAVLIRDNVDETYEYSDGNKITFKGTVNVFTKYPPAVDRNKIIPALKRVAGLTDAETVALQTPVYSDSFQKNENLPTAGGQFQSNRLPTDGGELIQGDSLPTYEEENKQDWEEVDLDSLENSFSKSEKDINIKVDNTAAGIRLTIENLNFQPDSAQLVPGDYSKLDQIAEVLKTIPGGRFLIEGHTADTGFDQGEMKLSLERARGMAQEFADRGLELNQFICKGSGSTKPVADNSTPEGKAKNRRVEITILE